MSRAGFAVAVVIMVGVTSSGHAGPLYDAAARGDLPIIEELLSTADSADEIGPNHETPLMAAALNDRPEIAAVLLEAGADVMARNKGGLMPIHAAAYGGSVEVVALLYDNGAVLEDRENVSGVTPFMLATEQGHLAVAALLIEHGADIDLPDREGFTPLTTAFWKRRTEVVRLLKQHGAVCQPVEVLGSEERYRQCVEAGS